MYIDINKLIKFALFLIFLHDSKSIYIHNFWYLYRLYIFISMLLLAIHIILYFK